VHDHSWRRHDRVWGSSRERPPELALVVRAAAPAVARVETVAVADPPPAVAELTRDIERGHRRCLQEEVQNQWNNNPVGSHYAKTAPRRTLEWYLKPSRPLRGYAPGCSR
jgi:hypothetical protein